MTTSSASPVPPPAALLRAADRDADQARSGDLPRERLVRPLLRDLPARGQHRREPVHAKPGTPAVNGLTPALLTNNPNSSPTRSGSSHSEALTCDQDHAYTPEQEAFDGGKMDKFVQFTETATCTGQPVLFGAPGLVMDYYDGNTVTGLWNYAQNYAISDNNYDTDFGPSTPGALNVIAGNDGRGYAVSPSTGAPEPDPGTVSALNSSGLGTIYVSHNLTDQSSIVRFIEDNWLAGKADRRRLLRRHRGQPGRPRRGARLPHLPALLPRHPQPHHRRGRPHPLPSHSTGPGQGEPRFVREN